MAANTRQTTSDTGGSDAGTERADTTMSTDDGFEPIVGETPKSELAEMRDRWMRSEAENANVRARAKRDVDDARNYAVQKFAIDAIETAENLHRALERMPAASPAEPNSITGLRLGLVEIERGFMALLERNGVKAEDPAGEVFDPNLHQAMAEQQSAEHVNGTVVKSLSPVWTLNGRLLKPAMVVVAKTLSPRQ
ncbi:MAG: nucleotide exchange factor GrpE [Micavibrio sp.]|nr:nucleotide exchange factor GrpE [Micavibrio sp.]